VEGQERGKQRHQHHRYLRQCSLHLWLISRPVRANYFTVERRLDYAVARHFDICRFPSSSGEQRSTYVFNNLAASIFQGGIA
jgi:hypothetical protein